MWGLWERIWRGVDEARARHPRLGSLVLLIVRTGRSAGRTRLIGLSAESAFFALLSLPALLLGLVGTLGHLRAVLGAQTVLEIREWILDLATKAVTAEVVSTVVVPLIDDFLRGAQANVLSLTFLVSLWWGSRAMNVFIEAITIAYGLEGLRGYFRQRVLAFVAYLGGLLFALVVLPVLVAGPDLVQELLPVTVGRLNVAYWPVVGGVSVTAVAMLYALVVPVRMPLRRHLPGAVLATLILMLGSALLRVYLGRSFGEVTIYGSLAAPIAILAWFWVVAMAVLAGSLLNAEIDSMWPTSRTAAARAEIAARRHARATRLVERREQAVRRVAERGSEDADEEGDERREEDAEGNGDDEARGCPESGADATVGARPEQAESTAPEAASPEDVVNTVEDTASEEAPGDQESRSPGEDGANESSGTPSEGETGSRDPA
ncbi:YihY/virulence factor BrkB family protein [Nocardiopsis gilva]|uniref:YihY/virulence factor BrkB family protein n=1 Tax=Nocardiopsis gilva TaxID=280236 RepID=UPI00373AE50C